MLKSWPNGRAGLIVVSSSSFFSTKNKTVLDFFLVFCTLGEHKTSSLIFVALKSRGFYLSQHLTVISLSTNHEKCYSSLQHKTPKKSQDFDMNTTSRPRKNSNPSLQGSALSPHNNTSGNSNNNNDDLPSPNSSLTNLTSAANCRVSSFIFAGTAILIAAVAYFFVTRFVFPLVTEYHDQDHHLHSKEQQQQIKTPTLCLIIGLSCAISTAVPGLFTVSCLAAGFALDFFLGAFVAVTATMCGLLISFEAGRTLFRERASALVAARFPSAQNLSQIHPTKAVWVTWFFPVPLAIKIFFWSSCSNVSLWRFLGSVIVVAIPHISTLAFIGDRASSLGEGKAGVHEKVLFVLGCSSVVVASFVLTRWAKSTVTHIPINADESVQQQQQEQGERTSIFIVANPADKEMKDHE